jgi:hypothetical protein
MGPPGTVILVTHGKATELSLNQSSQLIKDLMNAMLTAVRERARLDLHRAPFTDPYPTPYAVFCQNEHPCCPGKPIPLERDQYLAQMTDADSRWKCPICGSPARWDPNCPADNPPSE